MFNVCVVAVLKLTELGEDTATKAYLLKPNRAHATVLLLELRHCSGSVPCHPTKPSQPMGATHEGVSTPHTVKLLHLFRDGVKLQCAAGMRAERVRGPPSAVGWSHKALRTCCASQRCDPVDLSTCTWNLLRQHFCVIHRAGSRKRRR